MGEAIDSEIQIGNFLVVRDVKRVGYTGEVRVRNKKATRNRSGVGDRSVSAVALSYSQRKVDRSCAKRAGYLNAEVQRLSRR